MQFFYGDKNLLRVLDEAEFWKRQETEHTVVIREVIPDLESVYVNKLQEWQEAFTQAEGTVIRYTESAIRTGGALTPALEQQILDLIRFCIEQSQEFIAFLDNLTAESQAAQSNPVGLVVIAHIRRESEYFIGIAQTILYFKDGKSQRDNTTRK